MAEHVCHAKGCMVPVPPRMAMCRRHWYMVPKSLRAQVWSQYTPGQEIRKDPTPEYIDALMAAIDAVAEREARVSLIE